MKPSSLHKLASGLFWASAIALSTYGIVQAATTYTQSIKNGVISFTPVVAVVVPVPLPAPIPMPMMPIVDMSKIMIPAIGKSIFDLRGPPKFAENFPIPRPENNAEIRVS